MNSAFDFLSRFEIGHFQYGVSLKEHSWWRIGGPADLLVEPSSISHVCNLVKTLRTLNLPYIVIGEGSNLLFDDEGFRGVVIKISGKLSNYIINETSVVAEAGIFVPKLSRNLGKAGIAGLEHAIGIPGTLGGLILMNGGSQQKGVGELVDRVWVVDGKGKLKSLTKKECGFSYRESNLKKKELVIVRAELKLSAGDSKILRKTMLSNLRSRREKFPLNYPNCGSVFLSDPQLYGTIGPPGKIIEECGLKGLRIGDAMVSKKHANFIINLSNARAENVLDLIRQIRCEVNSRIGLDLKCEVQYLSAEGSIMPAHEACEMMAW